VRLPGAHTNRRRYISPLNETLRAGAIVPVSTAVPSSTNASSEVSFWE